MELKFKIASKDDVKSLAVFISKYNSNIQQQSLQCSNSAEDILADLQQFYMDDEAWFCMAFHNKNLVGVIGGDCDVERERLWIWGPYAKYDNWDYIANELYNETIKHWPKLKNITAYVNDKSSALKTFFLNRGFSSTQLNHNFVLSNNNNINIQENTNITFVPFSDNMMMALQSKQAEYFPNTYFSAEELAERANKNMKIIFAKIDEFAVAYIVGERQPSDEGFIHFLGVDEKYRRKGIATQLVTKLSNYFLNELKLKQVHLTVKDSNDAAKALYFKLGFTNKVSGVGLIKDFELTN